MALDFEGWKVSPKVDADSNTTPAIDGMLNTQPQVDVRIQNVKPATDGLISMNESVEVSPLSENVFTPDFTEDFA